MNTLRHVLILCFLCCPGVIEAQEDFQYGLAFQSYEIEKDERTGLDLTPDAPLVVTDGLVLEFYVSFSYTTYNFGYVFRMVGEDNEYIDLLLSRTPRSDVLEPQLTAIYNQGKVLCNTLFEELNTGFGQWIKVGVTIDRRNGLFRLALNGKEFEQTGDYFRRLGNLRIVFGKNNLPSFETSDVPTMSVRDITIGKLNGTTLYHWKLAQHTANGVYDELGQRFARCRSPKWILDNHAYWQKDTTIVTGIYPQVAFNEAGNEIGLADKNTFYFYRLNTRRLETHTGVSGFPLGNKSNQLAYHPSDSTYFTYNFNDPVAWYDPVACAWQNQHEDRTDPHYWYHNRFFSPADTAFYTFGGYGFHLYKNDIHRYRFSTGEWDKVAYRGDVITPRYLAGLGMLNEKEVLIFGGYGSQDGRQELSPRESYDLYVYNMEDSTVRKRWELKMQTPSFVAANSMVVDTLNRCFYALCFHQQEFNTVLRLYRFSIDEPAFELLADEIPYSFSDIHSYADLWLSNDRKKLIALTSYTDVKAGNAVVSLYTLAFPSLSEAGLYQQLKPGFQPVYGLIIFVLTAVLALWIWKRRKRKTDLPAEHTPVVSVPLVVEEKTSDPILGIKPLNMSRYKQAILLFGGFQVMDKEGNNITKEFTPTLKQLFVLTLLYTLKNGKGISSVKLQDIFWFDKSNQSAQNNRGVSLSKLRVIFEKVGGIQIVGVDSHWMVKFDREIYCDYYEAMTLMDRIAKAADPKDVNRLVCIVSSGELLPNIQTEWVDTFKSDFSNRLIDLLLHLIAHASELQLTQAMLINIANAIFVHDSLNEDALKVKCTLLVEMGKNGQAGKTYDSFIKEYQSLFGVDFKYTFEQIISQELP